MRLRGNISLGLAAIGTMPNAFVLPLVRYYDNDALLVPRAAHRAARRTEQQKRKRAQRLARKRRRGY